MTTNPLSRLSIARPKRSGILTASVAALLALGFAPHPVRAQTWLLNPGSGDWNTAANWNPATVPDSATAIATFGLSNTTAISFSTGVEVSGITFTANATSAYTISPINLTLEIGSAGLKNSSSVTQNLDAAVNGSGQAGSIYFIKTANAGSRIAVTASGATVNGGYGGVIEFSDTASAGNATITNQGSTTTGALGGITEFFDSSTAGNATLIVNAGSGGGVGGGVYFDGTSDGGTAQVIVSGNGFLDISGLTDAGMKVGSIADNGTFYLGSKTLTVGGNNLSTTVSGVIADGGNSGGAGGSLVKNGTGTLLLTATNTYTGTTTVNAGTLEIGAGASGNLAAGSAVTVSGTSLLVTNLAGGATFASHINLNGTGTTLKAIQAGTNTFYGVITGAGVFDQDGFGTTVLTKVETYSGPTNVLLGTLEVDGSLAAGSIVKVSSGATLTGAGTVLGKVTLTGNASIQFGSTGGIAGTLTAAGGDWNGLGTVGGLVTSTSGTFQLFGSLTAPAGVAVTGGTLIGSATLTGSLNYSSNASCSFAGVIAGNSSSLTVNKAGGLLTLTGTSTYLGTTTVSAGTLQIGDRTSGNLTGTSGVTVSGSGTLAEDLAAGSTFSKNVKLNGSGASLQAIQAGVVTFSGVISGTGVFDQEIPATTILNNTETYSGATNVNAGALEIDGSLAAASTVNVGTFGTLTGSGMIHGKATLTGAGFIDFSTGAVIAGTLAVTGGNWNGQGTVTGLITSSSNIFDLSGNLTASAGLAVTGGTLTDSGTLIGSLNYTSSSSSNFAGVVAGTGSALTMNKAGSTLMLTGSNTYTGATTVSAGTLQVGNGSTGSVPGTSAVTVSGSGTLAVNLPAASTFSNNVKLNGSGAALKAIQSGSNQFSGVISGTGAFDQNGTGLTYLDGAETYTGPTNVNAGTLALEVGASLAAGSTVNVGTAGLLAGTANIQGKATLTGHGVIDLLAGSNIAGTLAVTGGSWTGLGSVGGLVTLSSGSFQITGTLTAPAGVDVVTNGNIFGTGKITGNFVYTSSQSSIFVGVIDGSGATLTMNKANLSLYGNNTYTGATTVTAGTLQVGDGVAGSLAASSAVTIGPSGTLELELVNAASFSNTVTDNGEFVVTGSTNNFTVSAPIAGAGGFIKIGSNTATITGANTYKGVTALNGGTVLVTNTTGSATGTGAVNVNDFGTLGGDGRISGKMTLNSGGTIAPGAGSTGTAGTILDAASLTWNGGGTVILQLGQVADELALSGALTKGSAGAYALDLTSDLPNISLNTSYTLATFASTTFAPSNFMLELPVGYTGSLMETSTSLSVVDLTNVGIGIEEPEHLDAGATAKALGDTGGVPIQTIDSSTQNQDTPSNLTVTPTPEPGSAALLAFGAAALLGWRRRRKV